MASIRILTLSGGTFDDGIFVDTTSCRLDSDVSQQQYAKRYHSCKDAVLNYF